MFLERLDALRQGLPGAEWVGLVGEDGLAIESVGASQVDVDLLAAELVAQVREISRNHRELGAGAVRQLSVHAGNRCIVVGEVADRYYLLLVLGSGWETGRARFELKRARIAFESELA